MSSGQRKRKGPEGGKTRSTHRRRSASASSSMAVVAEPIDIEEGGEEVVDLTYESLEPVVVDLTNNDSVVIVEELSSGRRRNSTRSTAQAASCILSSDDDDTRDTEMLLRRRSQRAQSTVQTCSRSSGSVSCPICMDGYSEIIESGRLIVSTKCGHIFCSQCLRDALKNVTSCPTCRKKLTAKQYHPIYI